jgi:MFS family permease
MAVLGTTIVSAAIAALSRDLHSSLTTIQWVSTGYLLLLAAVIPLSGRITGRFGSKRNLDRLNRAVRARSCSSAGLNCAKSWTSANNESPTCGRTVATCSAAITSRGPRWRKLPSCARGR